MLRMKGTAAKKTRKRTVPATQRAPAAVLSGDALSSYLQALTAAAAAPVTITEARTRAKKDGHTVAAADLEAGFEQLAHTGQVFRHPSAARGAQAAHAYWHTSSSELVRRRLQATLGASTQSTLAKLLGCAPRQYRDMVQAAIATLLRERQLFEKPGGGKARTYTTTPLPATALLTAAQRKALQGVLDKINPARSQALVLDELLRFLDGAAPVRVGTAAPPTLVQLEELYRQDLPARGGLSSMPIPFTWRRYAAQSTHQGAMADRAAFEQLLLDSAAAGRVELIAHEWPATLGSDDLEAAIRQPGGRVLYYWRPLES
jgi:hypothetical protein